MPRGRIFVFSRLAARVRLERVIRCRRRPAAAAAPRRGQSATPARRGSWTPSSRTRRTVSTSSSRRAPPPAEPGRARGARIVAIMSHAMAGKVLTSFAEAIADVGDGSTLVVGGFGLCGIPEKSIAALREAEVGDLTVISNNCGGSTISASGSCLPTASYGKWSPPTSARTRSSSSNSSSGELEVELVPQGTLAERLRAGGPESRGSTRRPASVLRSRRGRRRASSTVAPTCSSRR